MTFCPKEHRDEAVEQVLKPAPGGGSDTIFYRCPHGGQEYLDPIVVMCAGGYTPETCPVIALILAKRGTSYVNVINFGSHLPNHTESATADDIENVFLVKAIRRKR